MVCYCSVRALHTHAIHMLQAERCQERSQRSVIESLPVLILLRALLLHDARIGEGPRARTSGTCCGRGRAGGVLALPRAQPAGNKYITGNTVIAGKICKLKWQSGRGTLLEEQKTVRGEKSSTTNRKTTRWQASHQNQDGFISHSARFMFDRADNSTHNATTDIPQIDEFLPYLLESCGQDDFHCNSGTCIPKNQRCNRIFDCPGGYGEDEQNCDCTEDEFQCLDDLSCIESRKRCDGRSHCNDGSDEKDCSTACKADQWQCDYGNCIKRSKRCDGRVDCPTDRSDERNCVAVGYFMCRSGYSIPNNLRCNRRYDCPPGDNSDEQNCRTICMAYEYKCSSGQCVRAEAQCNGTAECLDGSDESGCPCKRDELSCRDGPCINVALRCNGQKNCPHGEDELNCAPPSPSPSPSRSMRLTCVCMWSCSSARSSISTGCPQDQFTCPSGSSTPCARQCDGIPECDNREDEDDCPGEAGDVTDECDHECDGQCLDSNKICDGTEDCSDGSDELQCNKCDGPDDFRCGNGECINIALRCNTFTDCTDLTDELDCNTTMTSTHECTDEEFTCKNNRCINNHFFCDGNDDCDDNSDEENCHSKNTPI
ncbi:hypothetical protein MSG28_000798 [Choristoneura fumiferana]|uniref:Uncharacterized protein n=1 Tax=Choristoneura fumiferana TaxID=7141 RepID=A0ACC0K2V4_CHOFU|nr:hypothetical protein MSG28_000798 [Choristoneura fumiferana]